MTESSRQLVAHALAALADAGHPGVLVDALLDGPFADGVLPDAVISATVVLRIGTAPSALRLS